MLNSHQKSRADKAEGELERVSAELEAALEQQQALNDRLSTEQIKSNEAAASVAGTGQSLRACKADLEETVADLAACQNNLLQLETTNRANEEKIKELMADDRTETLNQRVEEAEVEIARLQQVYEEAAESARQLGEELSEEKLNLSKEVDRADTAAAATKRLELLLTKQSSDLCSMQEKQLRDSVRDRDEAEKRRKLATGGQTELERVKEPCCYPCP
jgi:chromosome segregation ATPase